jgi:hypothetical protein
MLDTIKKWWNRKWSDWEPYEIWETYFRDNLSKKHLVLKRTSNDGLIEYKKTRII